MNGHWTHGEHPFNPNNIKDVELLNKWKEKSYISSFYKNAIKVWADLDVLKIESAIKNNLNYILIYNGKKIWVLGDKHLNMDGFLL